MLKQILFKIMHDLMCVFFSWNTMLSYSCIHSVNILEELELDPR